MRFLPSLYLSVGYVRIMYIFSCYSFIDLSSCFSLQCYSLATIGYRVATFNDCVEASESLKQVRSSNFTIFQVSALFARFWF